MRAPNKTAGTLGQSIAEKTGLGGLVASFVGCVFIFKAPLAGGVVIALGAALMAIALVCWRDVEEA
ncbi:MAG: hypothetical protein AAFX03_11730 [Pseudomonadota bacterium]